jgi:hypothetical protein
MSDTLAVENHAPHETQFSTAVARQIEARRAGRRKNVRHGGALCSRCLAVPPRHGQGNCKACHAADSKARRARRREEGEDHG